MITLQYIKNALEFAPTGGSPSPGNLRGHWLHTEEGLYFICAHCAGRMIARGCSLGRAEPVWADRPEPFGVCAGCHPLRLA